MDVVQPLLARVMGLARLNVEVAGGSDSKIQLAYLTYDQAQHLRNHLLARAAGVRYDTEQAPEAPEHQVLDVPVDRLIGSLVLSVPTVLLALSIVVIVVSVAAIRSPGPVAVMAPGGTGRRQRGLAAVQPRVRVPGGDLAGRAAAAARAAWSTAPRPSRRDGSRRCG